MMQDEFFYDWIEMNSFYSISVYINLNPSQAQYQIMPLLVLVWHIFLIAEIRKWKKIKVNQIRGNEFLFLNHYY